MDFQNRAGGKTGGGGVASWSDANVDRRERLRQFFAFIDLECSMKPESSYLAHTQGKKHQSNLARRAAKEATDQPYMPLPQQIKVEPKKFVKIGRPGYKVTKERDPSTGQQALLFQIDYPEIAEGVTPRHRFMSAYEQKVQPPDKRWQYILFAAEPYETIAFKIPSREVDKAEDKFWTLWNKDTKQLFSVFMQFAFRFDRMSQHDDPPPPPSSAAAAMIRPSPVPPPMFLPPPF
ncbi:Splicing factor 3A subunit 2 [Dirofilaria immitis]|nr:Splicing factor 3A subunit 2 [Dirofilaria immitis]